MIKIWQIDLGLIARSASGYSGAELELLCREAAMYGLRELFTMADDPTTLSVTASVRSVVLAINMDGHLEIDDVLILM